MTGSKLFLIVANNALTVQFKCADCSVGLYIFPTLLVYVSITFSLTKLFNEISGSAVFDRKSL